MSTAILINCFEVPPDQEDDFLTLWRQADELLRSRGGYRSTRLHKALSPQARFRYINVAELDAVDTWQSIVSSPEFGAIATQMRAFHPSPGLYAAEISRIVPSTERA
jgi:heme-degrading monooxygenase HmoA